MSGDLKVSKIQFNENIDPAKNFFFDASANDGSIVLRRGNNGAPIEDVLIINAAGEVVLKGGSNLGAFATKSHAENGYQKLPGGLILQWGTVLSSSGGGASVTFPFAFPNNCFNVQAVCKNDSGSNEGISYNSRNKTGTGFTTTAGGTGTANINLDWFAIGN